jgi:hypothetical protein
VGITNGTIICRNDSLATPVRWNLSNRLLGADGEPNPELLSTNNRVPTDSINSLTGDYCLFEAMQRLSPDRQITLSFDLLEGMSLIKLKHTLSYDGIHSTSINKENTSLHRFVQFGSGILPTEYWLDSSHRLLIVTSMNKAYILDDRAEEIFSQDVEQARNSYRNKLSQRK